MTEEKQEILRLRGQVEALTSIVMEIATLLPDRCLSILASHAKHSIDWNNRQETEDPDYAYWLTIRDRWDAPKRPPEKNQIQNAESEIFDRLTEAVAETQDGREEGAALRLIQPYLPIERGMEPFPDEQPRSRR